MEIKDIITAVQKEIGKSNDEYFSYAWREKLGQLGEFLAEESKYSQLMKWIDKELKQCNSLKNIFSPSDKNENTTVALVNTYLALMQKLAVLVHCRELLLDSRSTTKMRENIEYTICKLYGIHYNEELKEYI
jgi:hypothetical protein